MLFLRPYSLNRFTTQGQRPAAGDIEAGAGQEKKEVIADTDASQLAVAPAPGDEEKQAVTQTTDDGRRESIAKTEEGATDVNTLATAEQEKQ